MPDITRKGIIAEFESTFNSKGIDEAIKKLEETLKKIDKVKDTLAKDNLGFDESFKNQVKKELNSLDAVYEEFNKKLADKDVKFAAVRNKLLQSNLGLSEKEIKQYYNNVQGLTAKLNDELNKANIAAANQTKGLLGKALSELQNGIKGHISTITGIQSSTLDALGAKFGTAFGAAGIGLAIVKLGELGEEAEQTKLKYNAFINSTGRTKNLLDSIQEISLQTGVANKSLQDAGLTLLKFGYTAEQVPSKLNSILAISTKLGIPIENLANQLGKINFQTFANKLDLRSLEREGIPIFKELANVTGKSVDELRKLSTVASTDVNQAIENLTKKGGEFAGSLDAQSNSLTNLKGKLSETFDNIKEGLGDAFIDASKDIIIVITDLVAFLGKAFNPAFQAIGRGFTLLFNEFKTGFSGIRFQLSGEGAKVDASLRTLLGEDVAASLEPGGKFGGSEGTRIIKEILKAREDNLKRLAEINALEGQLESKGTFEQVQNRKKEIARLRNEIVDLKALAANLVSDLAFPDPDKSINGEKTITEKSTELTSEQKRLLDELLKLQLQFREDQKKVGLEGLFDPKSIKSDIDVAKLQDQLGKRILEIQQKVIEAGKLGIELPVGFKVDSEQQIDRLKTEAERLETFYTIKPLPLKITTEITFTTNTSPKVDPEVQKLFDDAFGDPDKQEGPKKKSFLSRLFGDDKEVQKEGEKALIEAGNNIKSALNQFFDAEIAKTDFLIEQQKKRVDEVNKIAALGNAEQLQIEEERLRKLEERREQSVKRQNALNAIQIVAQTALAVSSYATAIAKAAAEEHPLLAIAEGGALLAAIAAGVIQVRALTQGFYEGTEYVDQKGHHRSGIDTVPSMLTRGERVMTVQQNEALGGLSNPEVVQLVQQARRQSYSGSSIYLDSNKVFHSELTSKRTIELLEEQNRKIDLNTETMKNTFVDIRFDEGSFHIHQRKLAKQAQKRSKIYR